MVYRDNTLRYYLAGIVACGVCALPWSGLCGDSTFVKFVLLTLGVVIMIRVLHDAMQSVEESFFHYADQRVQAATGFWRQQKGNSFAVHRNGRHIKEPSPLRTTHWNRYEHWYLQPLPNKRKKQRS